MLGKFRELTGLDLRISCRRSARRSRRRCLTEEGAAFLDPSGTLQPGSPWHPCEGDAGTGMTATNSVRPRTGNVSAGTSDFAMIVTERPLGVHREIDMVTTPAGAPVAMVHCNNCTSDINAWVGLFLSAAVGAPVSVMETAGEGGPYGMALLGAYMLWHEDGESLPDYLDNKVFAEARSSTILAHHQDIEGFNAFLAVPEGPSAGSVWATKSCKTRSCLPGWSPPKTTTLLPLPSSRLREVRFF